MPAQEEAQEEKEKEEQEQEQEQEEKEEEEEEVMEVLRKVECRWRGWVWGLGGKVR